MLHPAIRVHTVAQLIVNVPNNVRTNTVSIRAHFYAVANSQKGNFAITITVSHRSPGVPTITTILTPLHSVTSRLRGVTVTLNFRLTTTVAPFVVAAFVTRPRENLFLLAHRRINVMHVARALVRAHNRRYVHYYGIHGMTAHLQSRIVVRVRVQAQHEYQIEIQL